MAITKGERKIIVGSENPTIKIELPGAVPDINSIGEDEFLEYLNKLPLNQKEKHKILEGFRKEKEKLTRKQSA
jgi:hypothetical protein